MTREASRKKTCIELGLSRVDGNKKFSVQFTMTIINPNFPNVNHFFENLKLMMFLRLLPFPPPKGDSKFLETRELFQLLCVTLILYLLEPPFLENYSKYFPSFSRRVEPEKGSGCSCSVSIQRLSRSETQPKVSLG